MVNGSYKSTPTSKLALKEVGQLTQEHSNLAPKLSSNLGNLI